MLHRMRLYKSADGAVAVCADTHRVVSAGGSHLKAIVALNGACGCKHRKEYNIWEDQHRFEHSKVMRIRGNDIVERRTVTQLNDRVYGR